MERHKGKKEGKEGGREREKEAKVFERRYLESLMFEFV